MPGKNIAHVDILVFKRKINFNLAAICAQSEYKNAPSNSTVCIKQYFNS